MSAFVLYGMGAGAIIFSIAEHQAIKSGDIELAEKIDMFGHITIHGVICYYAYQLVHSLAFYRDSEI